ncbi:hypothetical protein AB1Y20_016870 [Prymnesium parvum]|uniref:CDAN1-interacting nuclease 1 n=1 Tax=Prymnesium parvum TaxID=97485 RepID=A0AB34I9C8_PRYPA
MVRRHARSSADSAVKQLQELVGVGEEEARMAMREAYGELELAFEMIKWRANVRHTARGHSRSAAPIRKARPTRLTRVSTADARESHRSTELDRASGAPIEDEPQPHESDEEGVLVALADEARDADEVARRTQAIGFLLRLRRRCAHQPTSYHEVVQALYLCRREEVLPLVGVRRREEVLPLVGVRRHEEVLPLVGVRRCFRW